MRIGILSDTHGRSEVMAAAVGQLRDQGAEYLIHCGDIGAVALLDHLAGTPAAFVLGNCDWDDDAYRAYAQTLGVLCCDRFGQLERDGKRLALIHGDDGGLMRQLLANQAHDYLLTGHTHVADDRRIGKLRVINPGALFRSAHKTVALLDTASDALVFRAIDDVRSDRR